jgi:hypothetical protein
VPTPDVERIVLGALTDDVEQIGATAQFWYPWRGGIEALPTALAERVGGVETNREVRRIDLGRRVPRRRGDEIPSGTWSHVPLNRLTVVRRSPGRIGPLRGFSTRIFNNVGVSETLSDTGLLLRGRLPLPSPVVPGQLQPAQRSGGEELGIR